MENIIGALLTTNALTDEEKRELAVKAWRLALRTLDAELAQSDCHSGGLLCSKRGHSDVSPCPTSAPMGAPPPSAAGVPDAHPEIGGDPAPPRTTSPPPPSPPPPPPPPSPPPDAALVVAVAVDAECSIGDSDSDRMVHSVGWVVLDVKNNAVLQAHSEMVCPTALERDVLEKQKNQFRRGFSRKFALHELCQRGRPLTDIRADIVRLFDHVEWKVKYLVGYNLAFDLRALSDAVTGRLKIPADVVLFDPMHAGPRTKDGCWMKMIDMKHALGLPPASSPHDALSDAQDAMDLFVKLLPQSNDYVECPCRALGARCRAGGSSSCNKPHFASHHCPSCPWSCVVVL